MCLYVADADLDDINLSTQVVHHEEEEERCRAHEVDYTILPKRLACLAINLLDCKHDEMFLPVETGLNGLWANYQVLTIVSNKENRPRLVPSFWHEGEVS